jgi:hypothetical protein
MPRAKTAYFTALREEMPELIDTATGREPRPGPARQVYRGVLDRQRKTGKGSGPTDTDATGPLFGQFWS